MRRAGPGTLQAPATVRGHWLSASPDDLQGTDLLAEEIREEAIRLVHHPVAEIKRLETSSTKVRARRRH